MIAGINSSIDSILPLETSMGYTFPGYNDSGVGVGADRKGTVSSTQNRTSRRILGQRRGNPNNGIRTTTIAGHVDAAHPPPPPPRCRHNYDRHDPRRIGSSSSDSNSNSSSTTNSTSNTSTSDNKNTPGSSRRNTINGNRGWNNNHSVWNKQKKQQQQQRSSKTRSNSNSKDNNTNGIRGGSSKSKLHDDITTTQKMQQKQEKLERQVELFSELSKQLEQKLSQRDQENKALRRTNQSLHDDCTSYTTRITNLEHQCVTRSAKVAQLSEAIATQKSSKIQHKLIEKSLEVADKIEETERYKIKIASLQKEKRNTSRLLLQMGDIVRSLNKVKINYDHIPILQAAPLLSASTATRSKANKLPPSIITTTTRDGLLSFDYSTDDSLSNHYHDANPSTSNHVAGFDGTNGGDASAAGGGGGEQITLPFENVQRKIKAIEIVLMEHNELKQIVNDRQRIIHSLKDSNANLNVHIASLKSQLQQQQQERCSIADVSSSNNNNNNEYTYEYVSESGSKEVSYEEFVVESDPSSTSSSDTSITSRSCSNIIHNHVNSNEKKCYAPGITDALSYEDQTIEDEDDDDDYDDGNNTTTDNDSCHHLFSKIDKSLSPVNEYDGSTTTCTRSSSNSQETNNSDENDDNDDINDDDDDDGISSCDSSFSSLEAPPSEVDEEQEKNDQEKERHRQLQQNHNHAIIINRSEYEKLQCNFNKALDVIERLKDDMKKQNREGSCSTKDKEAVLYQQKATIWKNAIERGIDDVSKLETELMNVNGNYRVLQEQQKELRVKYEYNIVKLEKLYKTNQKSEQSFKEVSDMKKVLQQQYDDLEKEYTMKIVKLQECLKESKRELQQQSREQSVKVESLRLKLNEREKRMNELQHKYDIIDDVHRERIDNIIKDNFALELKNKKMYEELRYEYDTFLEIHLQIEEEGEQARNHYKESLIKIRSFKLDSQKINNELQKSEELAREWQQKCHQLKSNCEISVKDQEKCLSDLRSLEIKMQYLKETSEKSEKEYKQKLALNETAIQAWGKKYEKQKCKFESIIKCHEEAQKQSMLTMTQFETDHEEAVVKLIREKKNEISKCENLRREFDSALVEHGKREQTSLHRIEEMKKEHESKISELSIMIDETEKLWSISKESIGNDVQSGIDEIHFDSKKEVEKLQKKLREASKDEFQRIGNDKKELEHQILQQGREVQKISEDKEEQKLRYNELYRSYQCSLYKIESLLLIQKRNNILLSSSLPFAKESNSDKGEDNDEEDYHTTATVTTAELLSSQEEEEDDVSVTPTTLIERIKLLGKQGMIITPVKMAASSEGMNDEKFYRDFDTILKKTCCYDYDYSSSDVSNDRVLFDILHHFVRSRKVSYDITKFSQLSSSILNEEESNESSDETDKSFLHKSAIPASCGNMPSSDFFSQTDSLGFSRTKTIPMQVENKLTKIDDTKHQTKERVDTSLSSKPINQARIEVERLHGENLSQQININASEIKSKAREKDVRLLELKYKMLRKEYQTLESNAIHIPPSSIHVSFRQQSNNSDCKDGNASCDDTSFDMSSVTQPTMHGAGGPEMDCLKKQIHEAEIKVKSTRRELQEQKTQVDIARKQKVVIDRSLETVISRLNELETENYADNNNPIRTHDKGGFYYGSETQHDNKNDDDDCSASQNCRGHVWDIISTSTQHDKHDKKLASYDGDKKNRIVHEKSSFDVSQLSSPTMSIYNDPNDFNEKLSEHNPASKRLIEDSEQAEMNGCTMTITRAKESIGKPITQLNQVTGNKYGRISVQPKVPCPSVDIREIVATTSYPVNKMSYQHYHEQQQTLITPVEICDNNRVASYHPTQKAQRQYQQPHQHATRKELLTNEQSAPKSKPKKGLGIFSGFGFNTRKKR